MEAKANNANGHAVLDVVEKTTRLSDAKLLYYKEKILERIDKEKRQIKFSTAKGNDTNDTSPTFKVLEEGQETQSKELNGKLLQRQTNLIQHLEYALIRIGNKTYGKCDCPKCQGRLIDEERLKSVLHTTKCCEAKNEEVHKSFKR